MTTDRDGTFEYLRWTLLAITSAMPIVGVVFFGRNAGFVLAYYWIEAAVAGLFYVPRIWNAGSALDHTPPTMASQMGLPEAFGRLTHIGRFAVWYLGFWCIYGLVVVVGLWAHVAQQSGAEGEMTLGRFIGSWATWETAVGVVSMLVEHTMSYMRADAYRSRTPREQGRRGLLHVGATAMGLFLGAGAIAHFELHPAWLVAVVVAKGAWEGRRVGTRE